MTDRPRRHWLSRRGVGTLSAMVLALMLATPITGAAASIQLPITASGQNLDIAGVPTLFTGVNAYELATDWSVNAGCGQELSTSQLDAFLSSLRPDSLVRFDAFEGSDAIDVRTGQLDWGPLDAIFAAAATYHVYLIPVITGQGSGCDGGHWQDPSWYEGGYRDVFNTAANSNGRGLDPLSYWEYMVDLVQRYRDAPALGMWEPVGEPEASTCPVSDEPDNCSGHQTCPDESMATSALVSFFDTVGGEIHSLDPGHLVEAGLLGGGQCGTSGADYATVGASPGIDVLSWHDYYGPVALGGDATNGAQERFVQAHTLDKPIITGEAGLTAGSSGCESLAQRQLDMGAKMDAQFQAGASAFLVWNWSLQALGPCSFNTGPGDPLMSLFTSTSGPAVEPVITAATSAGSDQPADHVTITGTGLGSVSAVSIDGLPAGYVIDGPDALSVVATGPSGPESDVIVTSGPYSAQTFMDGESPLTATTLLRLRQKGAHSLR